MQPTSTLLAALEMGLNRYLAIEPSVATELGRVSGRVLAVHLRELDLRVYLVPAGGTVQVLGRIEGEADAGVSGSAPAFVRLMLADGAERQALFSDGRIEMDGDTRFAERFFACFRRVDFDPGELLAGMVGDVAAHRAGVWLRGLMGWSRGAADTVGADVVEYLREETRDLVRREDVADWMDAADTLSADVDRLAARLQRLTDRLEQ